MVRCSRRRQSSENSTMLTFYLSLLQEFRSFETPWYWQKNYLHVKQAWLKPLSLFKVHLNLKAFSVVMSHGVNIAFPEHFQILLLTWTSGYTASTPILGSMMAASGNRHRYGLQLAIWACVGSGLQCCHSSSLEYHIWKCFKCTEQD